MRSLSIIHVVNVRWHNATAWYGLYLARLMLDAGHRVLVLVLDGTETHERAVAMGLPTLTMDLNARSPLRIAALYRRMTRLLDDFRPDVVDCHRGESFVLWGLLRRLRDDFGLVRTRGDQRRPKRNLFNRWLHGHVADAVVATNSWMESCFREGLAVPADRLHRILGGVDRDRFRFDPEGRERVRREFGYGPEHRVVGLLGRFDLVKGQRETIRAVARLVRDRNLGQVRLLLIGFPTATSRAEVEGWIRDAGIGEIVAITGERPDVAACISAVDVGIVASLWSETIARAALEIMSCGRPLLSSRVGVMPDLLSGEALFEPGDEQAMAALLERTLADGEFAARIAGDQAGTVAGLSGEEFLRRSLEVFEDIRPTHGQRPRRKR
jgi:glycosyltransferase involved in cell wall biosynthesis